MGHVPPSTPILRRGPLMLVRPFTAFDGDALLEVDGRVFSNAWRRKDLLKAVDKLDSGSIYLAVERRSHPQGQVDVVHGYVYCRRHPTWIGLERLAVLPASRRRGFGRLLLAEVFRKMSDPKGPTMVFGLVPESNLAALLFLRRLGFFARGLIARPFRPASDEDGVRMVIEREEWMGSLVLERIAAGNTRTLPIAAAGYNPLP